MTLSNYLNAAVIAAIAYTIPVASGAADGPVLRLGIDAHQNGEFEQAIEHFSRAIEFEDMDATQMGYALRLRGEAYLLRARHDEAIGDFTRLIELKPQFSDGYLGRGAVRAAQNDWPAALADYDLAVGVEPDAALAHGRRCETLAYLDRLSEAFEACNSAIALRANDADYYFLRASIHIGLEDVTNANADMSRAMRLAPVDHAAHIRRGLLLQQLENWDDALSDFNIAVEFAPDLLAGYFARANFYDATKQYLKAIEDYDKVTQLESQYSGAYNNRCYVLAKMGRAEEALEDCNFAIDMHPMNPAYLDSRAYAYLRSGEYENAIADYDAAISVFPQFSYALFGRGVAKIRLGDNIGGRADILTAEEIDSQIRQNMEAIDIRL